MLLPRNVMDKSVFGQSQERRESKGYKTGIETYHKSFIKNHAANDNTNKGNLLRLM